jgi:glycosyltransferase involved in cell wall biosynthesis
MVTTFFGPQSFGGDATYVGHLARSLARRGHEVEVVHCAESFRLLARDTPPRPWAPPYQGVKVHTLESPARWLAPLWTHQTGRPGLNAGALRRVFEGAEFDVIHFHNISLLGGPGVLLDQGAPDAAVKLMSLHDYWLVCPMHLMWKLGRRVCDRPQCLRCTVHGRRPPQLWRRTGLLERGLERLDALLAPSRYSVELHQERGIRAPIERTPYFLPADWAAPDGEPVPAVAASPRPYFAAAGRLIEMKGFERLIEAMDELPEFDLRLAGAGPREGQLRRLAEARPNVELLGLLSAPQLAELYRGARAVVVPSLFPETFGYVGVEAMSVGTPVIVSSIGALPELIETSGGGIVFESQGDLIEAMRMLGRDDGLRSELGGRGSDAATTVWSEDAHLDRYLELVERHSQPAPAAPRAASTSS